MKYKEQIQATTAINEFLTFQTLVRSSRQNASKVQKQHNKIYHSNLRTLHPPNGLIFC